jgi:hypothetical protein
MVPGRPGNPCLPGTCTAAGSCSRPRSATTGTHQITGTPASQSRGAAPWLPSAAAVREPLDRTRRAADLVAEAIRLARSREPRPEITGSRWQASTGEGRDWALGAGFQPRPDGSIPEQAIAAYNQTHPDRPY